MGAIALGDVLILNEDIIKTMGIADAMMQPIIEKEKAELKRRNYLYRGDRLPPRVKDKIIILVDDGIATGATMRAAILAVKALQPKKIIIAVPMMASSAYQLLAKEVDAIICLNIIESLGSISDGYKDFSQVKDDEVLCYLKNQAIKTE